MQEGGTDVKCGISGRLVMDIQSLIDTGGLQPTIFRADTRKTYLLHKENEMQSKRDSH